MAAPRTSAGAARVLDYSVSISDVNPVAIAFQPDIRPTLVEILRDSKNDLPIYFNPPARQN
jgi:hypothetical protein